MYDKQSGIRVDLIFSFSPYERQAIERSTPTKINDDAVQYATLEDVLIHKIVAGRPRDIEDTKAIMVKNTKYDVPYIEKWLDVFSQSLAKDFLTTFKDVLKQSTQ